MSLFRDDLIQEFNEYKEANLNDFSWWNYVNLKSDLQTALAFAKFFYPEVIQLDGYFLLKDKFNEQLFINWKESCYGDKICVEKMMNLYELKDFFHININNEETEQEQLIELGNVLKLFWSMSFKERFPQKNIVISVYEEFDSLFITVYEKIK
ncbi:hypothetical protein [Cytobacillus horneckiae]|uniref:hypothetical protein n=1 Tax=Cytobacillus horneckiae TaxID=549687 RepID=UPI003D9A5631